MKFFIIIINDFEHDLQIYLRCFIHAGVQNGKKHNLQIYLGCQTQAGP
jgi:hypothetical protein